MITIQTRQNSKGSWWCNTTHEGYDLSEEGETITDAQMKMSKSLERRGHIGECIWEDPKYYPAKEEEIKSVPPIGYASWRIDKGVV